MPEPSPSMKAWSHLLEMPDLAKFFDSMFEHLGVRIDETEEAFTVHHHGDKLSISEGLEPEQVDYVVDLTSQNIENMVRHGEDGKIDRAEAFAIVSILFTPLTRVTLKNRYMSSPLLRRLGRIENLIHVLLLDPDGGDANCHTLIHVNGEWIVAPGLHGTPRRIFRIDIDQAVDYQKRVFQAMKRDSLSGWWQFGNWYRDWRASVSS